MKVSGMESFKSTRIGQTNRVLRSCIGSRAIDLVSAVQALLSHLMDTTDDLLMTAQTAAMSVSPFNQYPIILIASLLQEAAQLQVNA